MAASAHKKVTNAVHRHRHLSKQGLLERAFTFAFRGLVYAQIWEDPAVDMEALAITPDRSYSVSVANVYWAQPVELRRLAGVSEC